MIVADLKKSIYNSAISGLLIEQTPADAPVPIKNIEPKSVPFTIPNSWRWAKLGDISNYGKNESIIGKEIKIDSWILELEDIEKETGLLLKKVKKIDRNSISSKNRFYKGDLLYGKLRPYLKKCIVADEEGYCSTEIVPIRFPDFINTHYIQIVLMSPYFLNYVNLKSYGSKMPRLGTKDGQNGLIPLPPLEEQQRIVEKVKELFTKLDKIKPIEDELSLLKANFPNAMKNSVLADAYSGVWSYDEKYENWNEKKLSKISNIYTGNSISESIKKRKYTNLKDGYSYIGTKDLNFDHEFNYDNGVKIPYDEPGFKYANKNSILMCIEGGSTGKKIGILDEKVCFGNKLCKFELVDSDLDYKYLYYFLQSPLFLKAFYNKLSGIIGGVSINKIKEISIQYPSLKEQQKIVNKIERILPLCNDIINLINE